MTDAERQDAPAPAAISPPSPRQRAAPHVVLPPVISPFSGINKNDRLMQPLRVLRQTLGVGRMKPEITGGKELLNPAAARSAAQRDETTWTTLIMCICVWIAMPFVFAARACRYAYGRVRPQPRAAVRFVPPETSASLSDDSFRDTVGDLPTERETETDSFRRRNVSTASFASSTDSLPGAPTRHYFGCTYGHRAPPADRIAAAESAMLWRASA